MPTELKPLTVTITDEAHRLGADSIARVPSRPVRRGLYFDARHNTAFAEMLKSVGWTGILNKYAWPFLKAGDVLVLKFPLTQPLPELPKWDHLRRDIKERGGLSLAITSALGKGIETCIYARRPEPEDEGAPTAPVAGRLERLNEPMTDWVYSGCTFIIDEAIREGEPLPASYAPGAMALDLFAKLGGKVVVEPAWQASKPTAHESARWGWDYPCYMTEEYLARMDSAKWVDWRTHGANVPEVMVQHHSALPPSLPPGMVTGKEILMSDRDRIKQALAGFMARCRERHYTAILPGDIFADWSLNWNDLA